MPVIAHFKMAYRSLIRKKLRSFLTMLGVIIGVASVITLVSLAQGSASDITENIKNLGSNLISVNISPRGFLNTFTYEEALKLKNIPFIQKAAPVVNTRQTVVYLNNKYDNVNIIGTNGDYFDIRNLKVRQGRVFTEEEVDLRRNVAVIGSTIAEELFGNVNPVGKEIRIKNKILTVIGVLESKGSTMGGSEDEVVLLPATTAKMLTSSSRINQVYLQAESPEVVNPAKSILSDYLNKKFKGDEEAYRIFDQTQILETVQKTTNTLSAMLGGIAAISLLVGGIGIMNIMLVSVTERTKEIGIRKALGATKTDILLQFLIESVVVSGIGGIIGIFTGVISAYLIKNALNISVKFPPSIILLSIGFSMLVGIFFGLYPASRAANMNPAEALRYE
ncbi:ABC transporter permease [Thermovenabulum sp.]|uniref:ABC transporter permease n=1 Tax=Thermovenabulum sp. TaxID=3100335 RepID=UPI003C7C714B